MLARNKDIRWNFCPWDVPAEGVWQLPVLQAKMKLVVTTVDLGTNVAISIAQDGIVKGLGAQLPYDQWCCPSHSFWLWPY